MQTYKADQTKLTFTKGYMFEDDLVAYFDDYIFVVAKHIEPDYESSCAELFVFMDSGNELYKSVTLKTKGEAIRFANNWLLTESHLAQHNRITT